MAYGEITKMAHITTETYEQALSILYTNNVFTKLVLNRYTFMEYGGINYNRTNFLAIHRGENKINVSTKLTYFLAIHIEENKINVSTKLILLL